MIVHHCHHEPKIKHEPKVVCSLNHRDGRLSKGFESVCVVAPERLTTNPNQKEGNEKSTPHRRGNEYDWEESEIPQVVLSCHNLVKNDEAVGLQK